MQLVLQTLTAVVCLATASFGADAIIHGVVTDSASKPVRGAVVKATASGTSVARYTQADGRYDITVPAGTYDVSVDAYGFAAKRQSKDTAQPGATDFRLTPRWDVTRLPSAELESLVPNTPEGKAVKSVCAGCHGLSTVMIRRGSSAAEWQSFIPKMTTGKMLNIADFLPPGTLTYLSKGLEMYFGPDSQYLGPDAEPPSRDQVKHTDVSDAALQATIREYTTPTPNSMPHSVTVDAKGVAWFSEYDYASNRLGRFDPETEKFEEYPVPVPNAAPHTGVVSKDGKFFYVPAAQEGIPAKLFALEIATGKIKTYDWPGVKDGGHTTTLDPTGNVIWFTTTSNDELWSFDIKKEQFKAWKFPVPDRYPQNSNGANMLGYPDAPSGFIAAGSYDVVVDSKGIVWFTQITLGTVVRLDPSTGATKVYKDPAMVGVRGITVDAQDNLWFCDFYGHQLGKLDQKTGTIRLYKPPTQNAGPYGLTVDRRTGNIWYADMLANYVTSFDPKTEKFVEYPIPTRNTYSRFLGVNNKGQVWFTEFWNGKIAVLDPGGSGKQVATVR
jgi:streptogramin lyase